jgi:hypothetical protein
LQILDAYKTLKGGGLLSSLVLDNYSALAETMKKESGDKSCPIWLFINPKSPSVRYDIWNPILDGIQDRVYRKLRRRIDTQAIYIKNVVSNVGIVSKSVNGWATEIDNDIDRLKESVFKYQPKIIITFGNITYELVRRFFEMRSEEKLGYWNTTNLSVEFEKSIANFDIKQTNKIPLPRRIMSNNFNEGSAYSSWEDGQNYFRDVAAKIADKIIENNDSLDIWID